MTPDTLIYDLTTAADAHVSPDGTRILYTLATADRASGKTAAQLWLRALDGGDARRLTWSGEHNSSGRWSPDGRQILFVSDRAAKNGLFVMPADGGGEARELTRHGQAIHDPAWSPDETRIAYTAVFDPENPNDIEPAPDDAPRVRVTRRIDYKQDNRGYLADARMQVFVLDVATGERRKITSTSRDHSSPQWSPDGRRLAARQANRNGLCSQLALIDVETGETELVGPEMGVTDMWAWSPSGDRIIFAGDTAQTFQLDFFLYDVAGRAVRRLTDDLFCLPDAGFPTIQPPAQPVWLDDKNVLFHALHAGASLLAIINTSTGAVETLQEGTATHAGLSVDRAGRHAVQTYSSLDAVGEIVVHDLTAAHTSVVTAHNAALLREHPPARWEQITVQRGAYTIEGWLLIPPDFDPARRYPVVLDVHGGPHGHYGFAFNAIQQCLATNGFLVLCANPRGSGSYGRAFAQQVVGDWGGEDYQDLMAMLDSVLQRPYADAERTGIYGYSYGGYMTSWVIGHTDRFKAAVCGAPCFDLESFYGTSDVGHIFGDLEFGAGPRAREEWYRAHSPSSYAHQARTPTLIIHGEADERCPIGQGEQMFVALLKAGCEVEFARYPGGSHLFLRVGPPEHRADVLARILGWFQTHLRS